jgi:hypothetical protein
MAQRLAAAHLMARRFRGFLPVVIDVETGGFHAATDALLEIAAVMIEMDPDGTLRRGPTHSYHVKPFEGGRLDPRRCPSRESIRTTLCVRLCLSGMRCRGSSGKYATPCATTTVGAPFWLDITPRSISDF